MTFWDFDGFDMFWYHQGTWSIKKRCRSDGIFTFGVDGKDPNPCATWSYCGSLNMHRLCHGDGLRLGQLAWSEPHFGGSLWWNIWQKKPLQIHWWVGIHGTPPRFPKKVQEKLTGHGFLLQMFCYCILWTCPLVTISALLNPSCDSCDVSWFRLSACVKSFDSGDCCLW